jgi:hypothetical protein
MEARKVLTTRRGVLGGIAAGLVGIGCCAGPTAAALLGIISASSAVSLADNLYGHWEWVYGGAGQRDRIGPLAVSAAVRLWCVLRRAAGHGGARLLADSAGGMR